MLRADPAELPGLVSRTLKRAGVRFSSVEGDLEFYVDPVPRVITARDWEPVKRGLAQRVRALNAFVADVYGEQRIVAEGVVPRRHPLGRLLRGRHDGFQPPGGIWIGVAGLDLVRDHTASGSCSRTTSARRAASPTCTPPAARCSSTSPSARRPPRPLDGEIDLLADTLRAAAPESARGHRAPLAAVLSDGEHNSAYWEHAWLSRQLGIPLVDPASSRSRDGELWLRERGLRERRRIDVIYRRTNADRLDSDLGRLLIEPIRTACSGSSTSTGPASPTTSSPTPTSRR